MKIHPLLKTGFLLIAVLFAQTALAHNHDHEPQHLALKQWNISGQAQPLPASFLMLKNGEVYLENEHEEVLHFPLSSLTETDQAFVLDKYRKIEALNQQTTVAPAPPKTASQPKSSASHWLLWLSLLSLCATLVWAFKRQQKPVILFALLGLTGICFGFKTTLRQALLGTDPAYLDAAFQPFKPAVHTFWDDDYFYVESKGIPSHEMMKGIVKWQQQVPLPQCYLGNNAWSIPLHPVLAATPVPVNPQHFLRGAVAIAANGVPIFNPYTNTGVDALVDGQLDIYGGHSGRADDYHYHTAPLHLDAQTPEILPIAFALDGFAVYGALEPDGGAMSTLDANHGHFDAGGVYHYHGTPEAPYMIGNMVGQVTEDATMQIIPQAKATPVRPSLTPLNGATITGCVPNGNNNGYILSYTKDGQNYSVDYSWTPGGVYTYHFIAPTGTTTQTYNGFLPCQVPVATEEPDLQSQNLRISPNPSTGGFSIQLNAPLAPTQMEGVQVLDLNGRLMYQKSGAVQEIISDQLAKGVYLVVVQFKQGNLTQKVVIQ